MRKWLRSLTPKKAWDQFVEDSVEKFISEFYCEGIRDIPTMCRRYAYDLLTGFMKPFALEDLEHVASLLEQYIQETGYDENNLYTEEELEIMWQKKVDDLLRFLGIER
ncbi:MAG TPA: hypothetical protein PKO38_01505 [Bacillota bacterium]|jgi:hypothetical protein|nr:hypothetical protein [Bacillota bacterium]HOB86349.1 hypothetical protein [Bacillota bacterium]HOP68518.1 hypothetical protein [Bacillota bacterium]HPT33253.1 hypothetical protein [Bacillota bacterium]HPZ65290.1 hypothetical protein [Bacillota bacterium]